MPSPPTRRRYPLRLALLAFVLGLLIFTVGSIAAVALFTFTPTINGLSDALFKEVGRDTSEKVEQIFDPVDAILRECRTNAQRGLLPVDQPEELSNRLVERFRYQTNLDWLSYGNERGEFVGAHRTLNEDEVVLNRSWYWGQPDKVGEMIEQLVHPDGRRELVRHEEKWDYDPRERPFYKLAMMSDEPQWTEPYPWWDAEGVGVTCALAFRENGQLKGVFTADVRLDELSKFMEGLQIGRRGRGKAYVLKRDGELIAGPGVRNQKTNDPLFLHTMERLKDRFATLPSGEPQYESFWYEGEKYAVALQAIRVAGDREWVTAAIVPEADMGGNLYRSTMITVVIGLIALIAAILVGDWLSRRIARPLQEIADDLTRVGEFRLSADRMPDTSIEEIAVVSDATERMKASLRSFARYVPTDLVRDLLASAEEAKVGAKPRPLTICFTDIEGFNQITQETPPRDLVEALSEYFEVLTLTLHAHRGTLDKFVGDGILAFFNAPARVPDHAAQACHAALDAQRALNQRRGQWQSRGRPNFITRIGLHTAEVLVGNIGTAERINYTVMGDGVNLASSLQSVGKVYGAAIVASRETVEAAGPGFEWRKLDHAVMKGRGQARPIFELLGLAGEVDATTLRARDHYEVALEAYHARRFDEAVAGFGAALRASAHDRAAAILRARAEALLHAPPPADWDGVQVHNV